MDTLRGRNHFFGVHFQPSDAATMAKKAPAVSRGLVDSHA
jgi:hypothetical protein